MICAYSLNLGALQALSFEADSSREGVILSIGAIQLKNGLPSTTSIVTVIGYPGLQYRALKQGRGHWHKTYASSPKFTNSDEPRKETSSKLSRNYYKCYIKKHLQFVCKIT